MNILYVVHDNKKGGAALSFLEMISIIRKEHNVYVVTPHKNGFIPDKLKEMQIPYRNAHYFWWKVAVPRNRWLACLRLGMYRILNLWNDIEAWRIKKWVLRKQIDIIHSNSSVINFGALLSKHTAVPHVWHLREYGEEDFDLKPVVSFARLKREMRKYTVYYIAISQSIMNKFANIVDKDKIVQIYNGVAGNFSLQKNFSDKTGPVKFLIAGNYCREKGQTDVVRAVVELKKQGLEVFEVYLAGNGDFAEPKKLVTENRLEKNVIFCGLVDDMYELRRAVDVEIVASKCEAFGRVTIEAMRMSNPVIGTNSGGTPELVSNGNTGMLFEYGNASELAECMKRFIVNPVLVSRMGQNAYRAVNNKFTPKENAENIMEVYTKIVGKK